MPKIHEIAMLPCESSQVTAHGHCPKTNTLQVHFKTGGIYQYRDFGPEKYEELKKAESIGKFLHAHVKGKHSFERMNPPVEEQQP